MNVFSLFSGIGGFDLALERQGYEIVGHSEIDKYADQIYSNHFTNKNYGDITKIDTNSLPDFELLVGGFPCQAFSIAGKRKGFEDTRGTLFFEIARIAREKQPRLLLLENVKGLLSHDKGNTFRTIITTLDELGYDLQWQVLNSKNFGVPQNRERVFIVGHFGGIPRRKVFPIGKSSEQTLKELTIGASQGNRVYNPEGISTTIASQAGGLGSKTGLYISHVNRTKGEYDLKKTETSGCLTSTMYKGIDASGKTGVLHYDDIGKTIRNGGRGSLTKKHNWDTLFDGTRIRRLTPKECERLQGFPDDWTKGISDTQRYKCLGNAVTVNVVEEIVKLLTLPPKNL